MGNRRMDHVVMEHHLAIGKRADGLAVLADVRDEHDARRHAVKPGREVFGRAADVTLLAKIAGGLQMVFLRQLLPTEDDDGVIEPCLVDRLDGG